MIIDAFAVVVDAAGTVDEGDVVDWTSLLIDDDEVYEAEEMVPLLCAAPKATRPRKKRERMMNERRVNETAGNERRGSVIDI